MKSSAPVCPVPSEQQPINEYQQLSESWFFRWATLDWVGYLKPTVWLWLLSWLVAGPVAATSFPLDKFPLKFGLSAAAGAMLLPMLAMLRLWLGWFYVRNRLLEPQIFYEESGWYDGQIWEKPEEVAERDRLVVTYQVQPVLRRLTWTLSILAVLPVMVAMIWVFL